MSHVDTTIFSPGTTVFYIHNLRLFDFTIKSIHIEKAITYTLEAAHHFGEFTVLQSEFETDFDKAFSSLKLEHQEAITEAVKLKP